MTQSFHKVLEISLKDISSLKNIVTMDCKSGMCNLIVQKSPGHRQHTKCTIRDTGYGRSYS